MQQENDIQGDRDGLIDFNGVSTRPGLFYV